MSNWRNTDFFTYLFTANPIKKKMKDANEIRKQGNMSKEWNRQRKKRLIKLALKRVRIPAILPIAQAITWNTRMEP